MVFEHTQVPGHQCKQVRRFFMWVLPGHIVPAIVSRTRLYAITVRQQDWERAAVGDNCG